MSARKAWLAALGVLCSCGAMAQSASFPRPAGLEQDVAFWRRVYTEIDTSSGFIHDSRDLGIVYRTVRFPEGATGRDRNRILRAAYKELRDAIERVALGRREDLSPAEREVLAAWPANVTTAELRGATERLRFQLGQSNRFRSGLIRAGTWRPYIEAVLAARGLPPELASLPHVESSFDPTAYSKVGAAGMWQFTRSTGLRYMRIDHIVDERRDPFLSTVAAARLLQNNFDVLESWPLALTAYNHGVAGMRQAVRQQKTRDIETIVRNYNGRTFGFASRNFYVAFLAALDVDREPERYFGPLRASAPANSVTVTVPDFVAIDALQAALDIGRRELQYWNPALMEPVWSGDKFVPRGFELRLPASLGADPALRLAAMPAAARYAAQMPDIYHRVARGDTISEIAARYGVSMSSLVALNGLGSRNFIRAGQVLRLPGNGSTTAVTLAQLENPSADSATYVVRAGDSVGRIARMFGVAEDVLMAQNGLSDRNLIYAGQELRIAAAPAEEPEIMAALVAVDAPAARAEPATPGPIGPIARVDANAAAAAGAAELTGAGLSRAEEQDLLAAEAGMAMLTESGVAPDAVSAEETVVDELAGPSLESVGGSAVPAAAPLGATVIDELAGPSLEAVDASAPTDAVSHDENVLASEQADLAADPSDYLVAADGTVEVQALETLGHYADWLQIRTQRLRDINGLPFGQAVVIGERLTLDFSNVDARAFEQRRVAYQQGMQEAFFLANQITDTVEHVIRPGESLWVLALRRYRVPVWLVRQFNPDLDLDQINPGTVVKFPELRPISSAELPAQAANDN